MTGPLTDTGAAGVGQYDTAYLIEGVQESVFFDGVTDLFGAGSDGKLCLGFELLIDRLLSEGG